MSDQLQLYCQWNKEVKTFQAQLIADENPCFVPSIIECRIGDAQYPAVVWPDGLALALPAVDQVILVSGEGEELRAVPVALQEILTLLPDIPAENRGMAYYRIAQEPLSRDLRMALYARFNEGTPLEKGALRPLVCKALL
jgi:hypothetical protein